MMINSSSISQNNLIYVYFPPFIVSWSEKKLGSLLHLGENFQSCGCIANDTKFNESHEIRGWDPLDTHSHPNSFHE